MVGRITPEADFNGEVTLSYAVTDPDGASTIAAYTFNVESINDAPERVGDQLTLGGTPKTPSSRSLKASCLRATSIVMATSFPSRH